MCVVHKYEDPSVMIRTHKLSYVCWRALEITALERQRQDNSWGSLASQPRPVRNSQVLLRDPVSKCTEDVS